MIASCRFYESFQILNNHENIHHLNVRPLCWCWVIEVTNRIFNPYYNLWIQNSKKKNAILECRNTVSIADMNHLIWVQILYAYAMVLAPSILYKGITSSWWKLQEHICLRKHCNIWLGVVPRTDTTMTCVLNKLDYMLKYYNNHCKCNG